jgi:carbon storage regulator CsrA
MLVLSRRKNETIVIDGQIEIEVLKISGNTVRLGVKAPRDVKVLRGELAPFGKTEMTLSMGTERPPAFGQSTPISHAG